MKMTKEDRDEWVVALRSGEYPKTVNVLRNGEGFCCLGVLCELQVKKSVIREPEKICGKYVYNGVEATLPMSLERRFDCPSTAFGLSLKDLPANLQKLVRESHRYKNSKATVVVPLTSINDLGATFKEIADLIEAKVEVVESYT